MEMLLRTKRKVQLSNLNDTYFSVLTACVIVICHVIIFSKAQRQN